MPFNCPTCETELSPIEIPRRPGLVLGTCANCGELAQGLADGTVRPLSGALEAFALGDDRLRAAISRPRPATLSSFLDTYEMVNRMFALELAANMGSLRTLLAQIENRLDFACGRLVERAFVDDGQAEALRSIQEARELVSTLARRNRGPREDPA